MSVCSSKSAASPTAQPAQSSASSFSEASTPLPASSSTTTATNNNDNQTEIVILMKEKRADEADPDPQEPTLSKIRSHQVDKEEVLKNQSNKEEVLRNQPDKKILSNQAKKKVLRHQANKEEVSSMNRTIILDGLNLECRGGPLGILKAMDYFIERGHPVIIVMRETLKTGPSWEFLSHLEAQGFLELVPKDSDDDVYCLERAKQLHASIVTNDKFREYQVKKFGWMDVIMKRRIEYSYSSTADGILSFMPKFTEHCIWIQTELGGRKPAACAKRTKQASKSHNCSLHFTPNSLKQKKKSQKGSATSVKSTRAPDHDHQQRMLPLIKGTHLYLQMLKITSNESFLFTASRKSVGKGKHSISSERSPAIAQMSQSPFSPPLSSNNPPRQLTAQPDVLTVARLFSNNQLKSKRLVQAKRLRKVQQLVKDLESFRKGDSGDKNRPSTKPRAAKAGDLQQKVKKDNKKVENVTTATKTKNKSTQTNHQQQILVTPAQSEFLLGLSSKPLVPPGHRTDPLRMAQNESENLKSIEGKDHRRKRDDNQLKPKRHTLDDSDSEDYDAENDSDSGFDDIESSSSSSDSRRSFRPSLMIDEALTSRLVTITEKEQVTIEKEQVTIEKERVTIEKERVTTEKELSLTSTTAESQLSADQAATPVKQVKPVQKGRQHQETAGYISFLIDGAFNIFLWLIHVIFMIHFFKIFFSSKIL